MLKRLLAAISICLITAGCQPFRPADDTAETVALPPAAAAPIPASMPPQQTLPARPVADQTGNLWERIRAGLTWQAIDRAEVRGERERYLAQAEYLPTVNQRAALYLHYIVEQVEARGMPMEVALLPLVESTLDPFATSPGKAAGLWQIIPSTGEQLGLEQDWWYDGRRDLRDSTRAALDYLARLHDDFDGDWTLALAAYNSGAGRIAAARKSNARHRRSTDFWSLSLPRETRFYVPRLIALSQIVAAPEKYGVALPPLPDEPAFAVVATGGQLEMVRAASLAGVDLDTLRALNPGQLRWATSPDAAQELLVPPGSAARFNRELASLESGDRVRWDRYRIRRGDSLIRIASKFDTEPNLLKEVNKLKGNTIRAGDTLLIPHGDEWADSLAMRNTAGLVKRGYRVRRGDSLYRIAGRFKVSIDDILAWNTLDPDHYLQPGQELTLYVSGG